MLPNQAQDLILSGKAPKALTVDGSLWLNGCTCLTHLPKSLTVTGALMLDGCTSLTQLPESLSVSGFLCLYGCTSLRNLTGNIKGVIYCDPEFVDQIEDWPLYLSYIPHFEEPIQTLIQRKLKGA